MFRMAVYWIVYNAALVMTLAGDSLVWQIPDILMGQTAFNAGEFGRQFFTDSRPLFLAMLVFCPLMIWDMMKYSHRIAGPLYRFNKAMRDHIAGTPLQAVKLRDDDMLKDFQDTYNEFVEYIKQKQTPEIATEAPDAEEAQELQHC